MGAVELAFRLQPVVKIVPVMRPLASNISYARCEILL